MNGETVRLTVGNTEVIAKYIQELTGGDLFQITPVKAYPEDYTETTKVAQHEIDNNIHPELSSKVENIESYDVIFLASPIWWGTIAPPVKTFLSEYDLSGKTIIPFCTHEGSGQGRSVVDIKKFCPRSTVQQGIDIWGHEVASAQNNISEWLHTINIKSSK